MDQNDQFQRARKEKFFSLRNGRLEELGNGVPEGAADRVQMMWTMISAYADMYFSR